jgi:hypothetical protein
MMKSIPDKAELALDFPDKTYIGSFERNSAFEARANADGLILKLERRSAPKRSVELHLHFDLLAEVLEDFAESLTAQGDIAPHHRDFLAAATEKLRRALRAPAG